MYVPAGLVHLKKHSDRWTGTGTDLLTASQVLVQADHSGPCQLEQRLLHLRCCLAACPPGWQSQALLNLSGKMLQSLAASAALLSRLSARCQTPVDRRPTRLIVFNIASGSVGIQQGETTVLTDRAMLPIFGRPAQPPCNIHGPLTTCSTVISLSSQQLTNMLLTINKVT